MEELRIQQLARSTILVQASLPDLALHLGFHCAHRFIHSRSCDILNHLIACDRKIYAERLGNSEHEPMANLGMASGAEAGVRYVLEMMRQEFDLAMALLAVRR
jgi:hypothetical protein